MRRCVVSRTPAMVAQALALAAVGLVLIVAGLTAPASPASEPVPVRWRPATEQERRDYDARQLAALLEELARQREGATSAPTAVTPETRTRTNPLRKELVEMTNVQAAPEVASTPLDRALADAAGQPAIVRIARTNMLREISRLCYAVDQDALPAPRAVRFDKRTHAAQLDFDTQAEAEAWAERVGGQRSARVWALVGAAGYHAIVDWRGVRVDLVSVVPVALPAAAGQAPAEHYETGGWKGGPGGCGVKCACGTVFDGFDSLGEATDLLNAHIVRETDPAAPTHVAAISERPAEPGEVCTCGRPAVKVFTGGRFGDTGYCGLPDGGQPGPCPFCGGPRHQGQRCSRYELRPAVSA